MPSFTVPNTAAVAIVGADLFANQVWARSPRDRVVSKFGMVGSAVGGDMAIDLLIDETRIGEYMNTRGGAGLVPNFDDMSVLEDLLVPAGAQLRCVVTDAAATEIVRTTIVLNDR